MTENVVSKSDHELPSHTHRTNKFKIAQHERQKQGYGWNKLWVILLKIYDISITKLKHIVLKETAFGLSNKLVEKMLYANCNPCGQLTEPIIP